MLSICLRKHIYLHIYFQNQVSFTKTVKMPQKYVQRCISCTANTNNLSEIVQQNSYLLSLLQNRSLTHRGERLKAGNHKKDLEAAFYNLVAKIISTERVFLGRAAKSFTVISITKDPQVFYRSNCLFNQRNNN